MTDSLFTQVDDAVFLPTEYSRGPWSAESLHGGPVAALMAQLAEDVLDETGQPAHVPVRLTLDLERPVLLAPVRARAEIVRPGRKVQVAEVTLHDEQDRRLARASVLAIRRHRVELPQIEQDEPLPPARTGGTRIPTWPGGSNQTAFHRDGTEHEFVKGKFMEPGDAIDWIRLSRPVLPDRRLSAFQRVVAAADFMNGCASVLSPLEWTYINPDLTVAVHRLPVGEWVAIDARTRIDADGTGTAEADLYDESGRLGHAVQTLLVEAR